MLFKIRFAIELYETFDYICIECVQIKKQTYWCVGLSSRLM